jgi:hypothetical protein
MYVQQITKEKNRLVAIRLYGPILPVAKKTKNMTNRKLLIKKKRKFLYKMIEFTYFFCDWIVENKVIY